MSIMRKKMKSELREAVEGLLALGVMAAGLYIWIVIMFSL